MNVSNRKNRNIGLPIFIFATSCNEEILQKKFCISLLLASTKRAEISIYIFLGFRHLSEAAGAVGLWPAAGPEEDAVQVGAPLVRRPLPCPESDRVYSFTATVRQGLFTGLSVFDEAPDWI